jgi:hypothetical protein
MLDKPAICRMVYVYAHNIDLATKLLFEPVERMVRSPARPTPRGKEIHKRQFIMSRNGIKLL